MVGVSWWRGSLVCAGVVLMGLPSLAPAQEPHLMDPIIVTGKAIRSTEKKAPTSFATQIDPSEHSEQAETVTDMLAESVGLSVRRFGGLGSFSTISIRGSASNQVQIYLDGIPLSRARNETVNLADLPVDSLQRIEVYRGSTPVGFSTAGIGGVVNLITKKPTSEPQTQLTASYGSFETRKVVASHSQQLGGVDVLGHVSYLGSKGDFSFVDDRGTDNPLDDQKVDRANNWFDSVEGLLKAGYDHAGGTRIDLTSDLYWRNQGIPALGHGQTTDVPGATLAELRSLNYLRFTQNRLFIDELGGQMSVFGTYERHSLSDRFGQISGLQEETDRTTTAGGGNFTATYTPLPWQELTWFSEVSHERFDATFHLARVRDFPDQTRLSTSTALQDRISWFDERLLLLPAVRYQHLEDRFSTVSAAGEATGSVDRNHDLFAPSIGVQVSPWEWVDLRGNLGHYERAPNFTELFGARGFVNGNARLRPEEGLNRDIGFRLQPGPLSVFDETTLEYAYFNNDATDLIVFVQNSAQVFVPLNLGAARLRGHEVSAHTVLLRHLGLDFNYTQQDTTNLTQDPNYWQRQLPGRPANEWYARVQLFNDMAKLSYELSISDGNFTDQANLQPIPARDVHTLGVSYTPFRWLTLSIEARNITDNAVRDLAGFPLPGLSFFGTVQGRLGGPG